jgi:hypothetical protein
MSGGTGCTEHADFRAGCERCRYVYRHYDRRRSRAITAGTWLPRQPAAELAQHLRQLQAAGMTLAAIADAAGLARATVYPILQPDRRSVQGPTAAAILAVVAPDTKTLPKGRVDATGSTRRVQALVAMGYSLSAQARKLGWAAQRTWELAHGKQSAVSEITAAAVVDLFERWSARPAWPDAYATRARNQAARNGWAPPLAWDDIDDPTRRPKGLPRYRQAPTSGQKAA